MEKQICYLALQMILERNLTQDLVAKFDRDRLLAMRDEVERQIIHQFLNGP
jgi:hypothetical protein